MNHTLALVISEILKDKHKNNRINMSWYRTVLLILSSIKHEMVLCKGICFRNDFLSISISQPQKTDVFLKTTQKIYEAFLKSIPLNFRDP